MGSVRSGACEPLFCLMPTLLLGNCLEKLAEMPDCSIDAIITDPPYGLSFMGKKWDYDVPSVEIWAECLRVLKPGGHLLAFAGTRTQHRMAVRIEDAGFEIRDMIAWVYSQGFPKSTDISRRIGVEEQKRWLDISKALDNLEIATIMEAWKDHSRAASTAGLSFAKSPTAVGISTPESGSVPASVLLQANPESIDAVAVVAELSSIEALRTSEVNCNSAQSLAENSTTESRNLATSAASPPASLAAKLDIPNSSALQSAWGWQSESMMGNLKAAEALKTWLGRKPSSMQAVTNALCVALTEDLKLITLNQSKTFQCFDTTRQTDCASAISVTITESMAECLILFTVDTLRKQAIDKAAGAEREVIGLGRYANRGRVNSANTYGDLPSSSNEMLTAPATPEAQQWDGWGTALKPALEPITVARKPFQCTVAANVLEHGTGAINIDGCRVGTSRGVPASLSKSKSSNTYGFGATSGHERELDPNIGRWPANLIHDGSDEVVGLFPAGRSSGVYSAVDHHEGGNVQGVTNFAGKGTPATMYDDTGSVARFFYCAKASKRERNAGLDMLQCISIQIQDQWGSEVHKVRLQVDMAQSRPRVTGGSDTTADTEWSTVLFGNSTTGPFPMGCKCITRMATSSTTLLETLNYSARLSTSENIADVNCAMESSTSHVANVESASRWKLSFTSEREACLPGVGLVASQTQWTISDEGERPGNFHPTCKPITLMRYLCRLVTPPSGTVLDPFMGSGSTGIAARAESFNFVGIELDPDYFAIAEQRIKENELPSEMLAD
jgi:DNA modification methylase